MRPTINFKSAPPHPRHSLLGSLAMLGITLIGFVLFIVTVGY